MVGEWRASAIDGCAWAARFWAPKEKKPCCERQQRQGAHARAHLCACAHRAGQHPRDTCSVKPPPPPPITGLAPPRWGRCATADMTGVGQGGGRRNAGPLRSQHASLSLMKCKTTKDRNVISCLPRALLCRAASPAPVCPTLVTGAARGTRRRGPGYSSPASAPAWGFMFGPSCKSSPAALDVRWRPLSFASPGALLRTDKAERHRPRWQSVVRSAAALPWSAGPPRR